MLRLGHVFAFAVLLLVGLRPELARCEAACEATVLGALAVESNGLRIVEPKIANLRRDDIVLQLNSHRLRSCADLDRALDEARRDELELMVLLQRGGDRRTEWIQNWRERTTVEPVAAVRPSFTPVPPTMTRPPAATATPRTAALVDVVAARVELSNQLALGRELRRSLPVTSAGRWIRRIDELFAERRAGTPLDGLDRTSAYYATIEEILAYREKATHGLGTGRNRAGLTLEYGPGSEVTRWLERYPFLSDSVSRPYDPERSFMTGRRMGLWSPDDAVRQLVEHAVSEGEKLDAELAAEVPPP